jgi:outer membrane protein assembly factor BamB
LNKLSVLPDGTVLVVSYSGKVYFLNSDGTPRAEFELGYDILPHPLSLSGGTVVLTSRRGRVFFLRLDGTENGTLDVPGGIKDSPKLLSDATFNNGQRSAGFNVRRASALPDGVVAIEISTTRSGCGFSAIDILNSDGTRKAILEMGSRRFCGTKYVTMFIALKNGTMLVETSKGKIDFWRLPSSWN